MDEGYHVLAQSDFIRYLASRSAGAEVDSSFARTPWLLDYLTGY